ncbi:hypothetical protein PUN28_012527 [Cardiocondyla obscurior]|uniref:Uncharacterized protein n=1 Tax=Cardiocondyla obscurior TaxID=286306 RepID=A0AAW2FEG2_9HYME
MHFCTTCGINFQSSTSTSLHPEISADLNFLEVIHEIIATAHENLQIDVTEDARSSANIVDSLQETVEIIAFVFWKYKKS